MENKILLIIFFPFLINCGGQKKIVNQEYKKCVNKEILSSINGLEEFAGADLTDKNNFDFFDTIAEFEQKLLHQGFLSGIHKIGYENLIAQLQQKRISTKMIGTLEDEHSFIAIATQSFFTNRTIYNTCPYIIIEMEKSRRLASFKDVYDRIMLKGFRDFSIEMKELSGLIDYNSEIERMQLTYLIYLYMNSSYWNYYEPPKLELRDDGLFYKFQG